MRYAKKLFYHRLGIIEVNLDTHFSIAEKKAEIRLVTFLLQNILI